MPHPQKSTHELTLLEHINELRQRLIRAVIALIVGALAGTLLTTPAIEMLVAPLGDSRVVVLSPTEAPIIYFKVALYLGVILTGMGADGREGCRAMKQTGCKIWSQDEASCVVYGMPAAVAEAGLSDQVLTLADVGPAIIRST